MTVHAAVSRVVTPEPFRIAVAQGDVDDLRERLRRTRWPDRIPGSGWTYGADLAAVHDVVHWYGGMQS